MQAKMQEKNRKQRMWSWEKKYKAMKENFSQNMPNP